VSVTMQPRNLLPVAALAVLDALDELAALAAGLLLVLVELAVDELLPHAASSKAAAPAAAAVINAVCFTVSSPEPGCRCPAMLGTYPVPGCPKVNSLSRPEGRGSLYCGHLVAEPRPETVMKLDSSPKHALFAWPGWCLHTELPFPAEPV